MSKVSDSLLPKILYVFGDMSGGGHNLQAFKTIYYSGAADNCVVVSLSDGDDKTIENKLGELGLSVIYLNMNKFRLSAAVKELRRIAAENNCAIAHSNGLKSDLMCSLAFGKSDTVHIITLHNYLKEDAFLRMSSSKAKIAVSVQKRVLNRCGHIIACSKTLCSKMLADNPKLRITAIQNGVDIANFVKGDKSALRKQHGVGEDKIIIISTGRMVPIKRIIETAEAFLNAGLPEKYELWMVGSGECFEEYKNRFSGEEKIRFLGRRSDIADLLSMADVFVSSSESEGLPLAVLEAVSAGLPVYLSDIPQHLEITGEYPDAGKTYTLGNTDELARLFRGTEDYLQNAQTVSLEGGPFDITVMGDSYRDYYIEAARQEVKK